MIAVAWGAARLDSVDDGHDCPIPPTRDDTDPESSHDGVVLGLQEAAVLLGVPLGQSAMGLVAFRRVVLVVLPAFLDDWLRCFACRWRTVASVVGTWLVAEGAAYLFAHDHRGGM